VPGQAVLTGGLFLLVFALLQGSTRGRSSTPIVAGLMGAGALLAGFVVIELRSRHPILPRWPPSAFGRRSSQCSST
jgi:hypothetical protein